MEAEDILGIPARDQSQRVERVCADCGMKDSGDCAVQRGGATGSPAGDES